MNTITVISILLASGLLGYIITFIITRQIRKSVLKTKVLIANEAGNLALKAFDSLNIQEKIGNPALLDSALPMIETHIDEFLNVKLKEEMPMISMFIGNKTTDKLKEVFIAQLKQLFPNIMNQFAGNLSSTLNIGQKVSASILAIPDEIIEAEIQKRLGSKISLLHYAGAVGGFLIGLVNLLIFLLTANQ